MVRDTRRLPADDRREQILEVAHSLFSASSFCQVGTADMAKAAGISEPALYRYFTSKKELFLATLRSAGSELLKRWQGIADEYSSDPIEALKVISRDYFAHLEQETASMRLHAHAVCELDDDATREALGENFLGFAHFISGIIEDGKRQGVIRKQVNARFTAWQFLGIGWVADITHLVGIEGEMDTREFAEWSDSILEVLRDPTGVGT